MIIKSKKQKYFSTATTIFLIILAVFMFFPIYLTITMAFKPPEEMFVFPPKLYTLRPTLDNFRNMFASIKSDRVPFSRYLFNSIFVTLSVTLFQVIFVSMAAFVLAKYKFPFRDFLNAVIVTALLYQANVIYLMQYIVMSELSLINNPLALILPSVASPMGLFLMRQSVSQLPDSIIESAKIDGAGIFRICWCIVIPNEKPAVATLVIFAFQAAWNIQGGNIIFDEQYKTLPTVINQISASGIARAGEVMASAVFMLLPPVVIFALAQNHVVDTMAHSGIKN